MNLTSNSLARGQLLYKHRLLAVNY